MAKSKAKVNAPEAAPTKAPRARAEQAPRSTAGFYKKSGDRLQFAPTKVHFPGGTVIEVAKHGEYEYPVQGWNYYESAEAAYAAEGLPQPEPVTRESIAAKIAARKSMTPEQKEAERAQRDAEHIARIQERNPERAAQLQARAEQRQAKLAERALLAAMGPEERKAARIAKATTSELNA